jgi:biotin operon repressor
MATGDPKQRERVLQILQAANGAWVPLPEILALGIAQYSARIHELRRELRREGFDIENRMESLGGSRHSWFRLVPRAIQPPTPKPEPADEIPWEQRQPVTGLPLFDLGLRR